MRTGLCTNRLQKTMHNRSFTLFCFGVMVGIVFFFLWKKQILLNSGKMIWELLIWKQYTEIKRTTYLLFVLQYRAKSILLFLLFAGIWNRQMASRLFLLGMGVQLGLVTSVGMALYGVLGILFTVCVYFPHGLCYLLAVVLMGKKTDMKDILLQKELSNMEKGQFNRNGMYTVFASSVFTIIGILLEVYVNLKIFFKFLKILKIL